MAKINEDCIVRDAKDVEEARGVWWPLLLELGWNRADNDAAMHWNVSRSSRWLVVQSRSDHAAKPEGCIVPFIYDNKTAWVGFFILNEPMRGKGWGAALFRATIDEFKRQDCAYIGLDAVAEQKKTYERRGFREVNMVKNMFRDGFNKLPLDGGVVENGDDWRLEDIRNVDESRLVDFEELCTGFRRSRLWSHESLWHRPTDDTFGFAAISPSSELKGLILVRACHQGWRFGPVYATDASISAMLLRAAMQKAGGLNGDGTLSAEVYKSNQCAVKLFEDQGWKDTGIEYHRMWVDAKASPQQMPGGVGEKFYWSVFDAGEE